MNATKLIFKLIVILTMIDYKYVDNDIDMHIINCES